MRTEFWSSYLSSSSSSVSTSLVPVLLDSLSALMVHVPCPSNKLENGIKKLNLCWSIGYSKTYGCSRSPYLALVIEGRNTSLEKTLLGFVSDGIASIRYALLSLKAKGVKKTGTSPTTICLVPSDAIATYRSTSGDLPTNSTSKAVPFSVYVPV